MTVFQYQLASKHSPVPFERNLIVELFVDSGGARPDVAPLGPSIPGKPSRRCPQ